MGQQFEFKLAKDFSAASVAGPDGLRAQPAYGVYPLPALLEADSAGRDRKAKRLKAVKAEPALLPKSATAEDAFRLTLMQCKWHIAANFQAVVQARSPEGLH